MMSKRDFCFFLIMFFIELVHMSYKVAAGIATNIILIMIFRNFTVNGFLYIYCEILIIHERAGVCLNNVLLTVVSTVF